MCFSTNIFQSFNSVLIKVIQSISNNVFQIVQKTEQKLTHKAYQINFYETHDV